MFEEVLQPGATWSHVLKRGTALRITDTQGGANVGAIFYNWENPTERYNLPDTLKAQHIAHFTSGHVLYSDMGRVLCSITFDTVGWHDPLSGCSKYGLGPRDMSAAVNFFSKVVVDDAGDMQFISSHSTSGMFVELRAEMNVLVILNSCQHPLDPNITDGQFKVILICPIGKACA